MEFTPPMRALLTGLSKQSNTPITLQTQPPGIPSSSYINQSVDSGPSPMIDNPAPEDQSMNTSTPQSTPSFFPNVTYQPTLMHEQPQIQSQPMPETKPIEQKPEQPQPPIMEEPKPSPQVAEKKPNKSNDLLTFLNGQGPSRGLSQGISASGTNYGMAPNRNVGGYQGQQSSYSYGSGFGF